LKTESPLRIRFRAERSITGFELDRYGGQGMSVGVPNSSTKAGRVFLAVEDE